MLCLPTFLINERPIKKKGKTTSILCRKLVASFKEIVENLRESEHTVYCALDLYKWQSDGFKSPKEAIEIDWKEIQKADHVIACPTVNDDASSGVHVEIGWATALKKPLTILIHRSAADQTVMVTGLITHSYFNVQIFQYENEPLEILDKLIERIEKTRPKSKPFLFPVVKKETKDEI